MTRKPPEPILSMEDETGIKISTTLHLHDIIVSQWQRNWAKTPNKCPTGHNFCP